MTETVLSHADGDPGAYETLVLGIGNVLWDPGPRYRQRTLG
jgi:hypothetical protein